MAAGFDGCVGGGCHAGVVAFCVRGGVAMGRTARYDQHIEYQIVLVLVAHAHWLVDVGTSFNGLGR